MTQITEIKYTKRQTLTITRGSSKVNNGRNLLAALKAELEFVEKRGYRNTDRAPRRPHFIFQDSPTCLNFDPTQQPKPCSECVLMQLVPPNYKDRKIPCRHIPLNDNGETIDYFYRSGSQEELEIALVKWLKTTIEKLEREETKQGPDETEPRRMAANN